MSRLRKRLGWCVHCFKALTRNYHHQLLPVCDIILRPDDFVIDVGAHAGQFARMFARFTPAGCVLAVEPAAYPLSILRIVRRVHRLKPVQVIAMALGAQAGEALLQTPLKQSGVVRFGLSRIRDGHTGKPDTQLHSETVVMTTVDALVEQYRAGARFALLKADIEGYEYDMLQGAMGSIRCCRPCLLLEVSSHRQALMALLRETDYVVFGLLNYGGKRKEPLHLAEILPGSTGDARNILAIPASNPDVLETIRHKFCQPVPLACAEGSGP